MEIQGSSVSFRYITGFRWMISCGTQKASQGGLVKSVSHRKGLVLRASISYSIPVTPELPNGEAKDMAEISNHCSERYDQRFETPMGRLIKGYGSLSGGMLDKAGIWICRDNPVQKGSNGNSVYVHCWGRGRPNGHCR